MKVLTHDAYISGMNISGLEYNIKKEPYEDFWRNQEDYTKDLFISEPCPIFPFSDTILVSKGFYDFAHIPSTLNTIFVSEKMLEVFALLNMPKFQYWPIQYKVRGKMYEGYWLAFYHDYGLDTDFSRSVFKMSYQDNKPDEYLKLKNIDEYRSLIKYRYTHQNQKRDFAELVPIQIKFLPYVYELDLITIFHYYTVFLASDKCIDLFEKFKIKKFIYFNHSITNGTEYI